MVNPKKTCRKFKSSSTGEPCTVAQYLAEVLIQRKAEKDNKGSLAYKFWNKSQKKQYQAQIISVNRLMKQFGEDVVYDYLIYKNPRVFSVGQGRAPAWIVREIEEHKERFDKKKKIVKPTIEIEPAPTDEKPPKPFGKTTLFSKLRTNDGKKGR